VNFYFHNAILSHNSTLSHIIFKIPWYVDLVLFNFNVAYLAVLVPWGVLIKSVFLYSVFAEL